MLIAASAGLAAMFVSSPIGTLGKYGYPQAWKGGPLLLGTAFLSINGFFLLIQRRFSLAALLLAGFVSGALTAGGHAYVMSIRDRTTFEDYVPIQPGKAPDLIALVRKTVTPEYLKAVADDAYTKGWLPRGFDFDSVMMTYGLDPRNKNELIVTLTFEFSPYVNSDSSGAQLLVRSYSAFVHSVIASKLDPSPNNKVQVEQGYYFLISNLTNQQPVGSTAFTASAFVDEQRKKENAALKWLYEREPNLDVKEYLKPLLP